jgi:hypothetical protein
MTDSFSTTSLRAAFRYPFCSPEGLSRFVVGVALLLLSFFIPVLPAIFVCGYLMLVMRRIIQGEAPALPEWKDWSRLGVDGLRSLVVAAIYLGPGLVIMFGGWLLYLIMYLGGMSLLQKAPHAAPSGIALMLILGALGTLFLSLFASLCLVLIGGVPLPAALAHLAARDKLSAAFNVFEWGAILTADRWGYFISWVVTIGLATLLQFLVTLLYFTIILCAVAYVIILPLGFYLMLVAAAVFAQAYRKGAARLQTPAPESAPTESGPEAEPASAPEPTPTEPADATSGVTGAPDIPAPDAPSAAENI